MLRIYCPISTDHRVAMQALTLTYFIVTSALDLVIRAHRKNENFTPDRSFGSIVTLVLSTITIWPIVLLLKEFTGVSPIMISCYSAHLRWCQQSATRNLTQLEEFRQQDGDPKSPRNPFQHASWMPNLLTVLCAPPGFSWLDGPGIATEDKRKVQPSV